MKGFTIMQINTEAQQVRADWTKLAWPAAILISIAGAAVGRAQVATYTSGNSPAGNPQNQAAPADAAHAGGRNDGAQPGQTPQPNAGLNGALREQGQENAPVSDPFAGGPNTSPRAAGAEPARSVRPIRANAVKVDENGVVDLRVNGEEVTAVLEMLSLQAQKNIIPYKNVSGRVFANLYGVTFYEALDALLHANGFGYVERGNFIYVYTLEDLQKLEKEARQRTWRVIRLNYLSAVDAAAFAQPLLSKDSVIKTNSKVGNFPGKSEVPVGGEDYPGESTIMVFDFPEQVEQIEKLIKELDTRPAQVLVEATILQTQLDENNAFGVDFALLGNLNFGDFLSIGGPLKVPDAMIVNNASKLTNPGSSDLPIVGAEGVPGKAFGLASTPGNTSGPGTLKLGLYNSNVGVFVRMLDEVSDTTILSNPKILALNRQPARVLIGQRVGYLNTTSTNTATTQTVEFLDTGTQLHFRPFVGNDGTIRLELKPSVSTAVIRDVRNSAGAVVTVPDEITNELTTNVIVRDGQTVVLGGLFRESTKTSRRQVPLLGDIPLVGKAFRGQEDEVKRQEIIFLITPSIVSDSFLAESGAKSQDVIARVRTGAREGLLEFSRERLTSSMVSDARKLAAEGKSDKALWKLNMALSMNPRQVDAIELKESLTGEKASWPHRSMLQDLMQRDPSTAPKPAVSAPVNPSQTFNPAPSSNAAPVAEPTPQSAAQPAAPIASVSQQEFQAPVNQPVAAAPAVEVSTSQASAAAPAPATVPTTVYQTVSMSDLLKANRARSAAPATQEAQGSGTSSRVSAFGKLFGGARKAPANAQQSVSNASQPEADK